MSKKNIIYFYRIILTLIVRDNKVVKYWISGIKLSNIDDALYDLISNKRDNQTTLKNYRSFADTAILITINDYYPIDVEEDLRDQVDAIMDKIKNYLLL